MNILSIIIIIILLLALFVGRPLLKSWIRSQPRNRTGRDPLWEIYGYL